MNGKQNKKGAKGRHLVNFNTSFSGVKARIVGQKDRLQFNTEMCKLHDNVSDIRECRNRGH